MPRPVAGGEDSVVVGGGRELPAHAEKLGREPGSTTVRRLESDFGMGFRYVPFPSRS